MKRYFTLPIDVSELVSSVVTYLNANYDIEDSDHYNNTFHQFDPSELSNTTVNTMFSGLTVRAVCHASINASAMYNHRCDQPLMCIPLLNCDNTVLKLFDIKEGALPQTTVAPYFLDEDCVLQTTIPLTGPVLLDSYTPFKMETSDTTLSHVLMLWFNEYPVAYIN